MHINPKAICASCGMTRDAHWGAHPIAASRCTGFQSMTEIDALAAIRARINGEWDHPELVKIGALGDTNADILRIIDVAEGR